MLLSIPTSRQATFIMAKHSENSLINSAFFLVVRFCSSTTASAFICSGVFTGVFFSNPPCVSDFPPISFSVSDFELFSLFSIYLYYNTKKPFRVFYVLRVNSFSICSITATLKALPNPLYLCVLLIPSVQLSGKHCKRSHSTGVSFLTISPFNVSSIFIFDCVPFAESVPILLFIKYILWSCEQLPFPLMSV